MRHNYCPEVEDEIHPSLGLSAESMPMHRRQFLCLLTFAAAAALVGAQTGLASNVDQIHEVEKNYEAFRGQLPSLMTSHRGKFALMRNEQIIEFFDTARDAYKAGQKLFPDDHLFSI
jgi:hypothetical protein